MQHSRKHLRSSKKSRSRRHSRSLKRNTRGGYTYKKTPSLRRTKSRSQSRSTKRSAKLSRRKSMRGGFLNALNKLKDQAKALQTQVIEHPAVQSAKQSVMPHLNTLQAHVNSVTSKVADAVQSGASSDMAKQAMASAQKSLTMAQETANKVMNHPDVQSALQSVNKGVASVGSSLKSMTQ